MFKSRPIQYLGLLLLVLACLLVIFYPVGPRPKAQEYAIRLTAPRSFQQLAGAKQQVGDVADKALAAAFPAASGARLPASSLTVVPNTGGTVAEIRDRAETRAEAQQRVGSILTALKKPFKGVSLAPQTQANIQELPPAPVVSLGNYALFPPRTRNGAVVPAMKLGLDLQGGVSLVLQVRRALFSFTPSQKLPTDADARDEFLSRLRNALAQAPASANLSQADVNFAAGGANQIEIRTQATDRDEFEAQKTAIAAALKNVQGATFKADRAQFFEPDASTSQQLGTSSTSLLNQTVEIVRSRVDKLGVAEPLIQAQGRDRIVVQLPGVNDPQQAVEVVGQTAQMRIFLLPQELTPVQDPQDANNTLFRDQIGNIVPNAEVIRRSGQPIVSGQDVKPTSTVGYDQGGEPAVYFELQGAGAARFGEQTTRNVNRIMPIFLDEKAISAPVIRSPITGGSGQISGGFATLDEARSLAILLNSGALPAPIDVVENRTVSATLGEDSLRKSVSAGLIGIVAVVLFMILYYRLPGLLADFALAIYVLLNLAVFILVGATLTLPGIAGFLLAIAISLDTNILVFERLKEEMSIQPTFAAALRAAFSRAWTAILDSHVTTLIASVVLFYLGTGPVKGFALTLGIGVLLSLFSAISVTRLFMWSAAGMGERKRGLFGRAVQRAVVAPTPTGARGTTTSTSTIERPRGGTMLGK